MRIGLVCLSLVAAAGMARADQELPIFDAHMHYSHDAWTVVPPKEVVEILKNTSSEGAQRTCQTESLHTIEWLAADYIKHLSHHVHQVLELEPVPYP